jgi:membrane protein required for colicin V production
MLNALDVAIVATFLTVIALGFFNGVSKVTSAILAIYFGSIISAAFYRPVTDGARNYVHTMSESTGQLFFFVILFFVFSSAFTFMISNWLGGLKLPRRVEIVDNLGGAALGVVVSGLAVTLAAMLLVILLQALNQTFGPGSNAMVGWVHNQIDDSALVPVFLKMAPHFVRLISPWFPSGLPPILSGGAGT